MNLKWRFLALIHGVDQKYEVQILGTVTILIHSPPIFGAQM